MSAIGNFPQFTPLNTNDHFMPEAANCSDATKGVISEIKADLSKSTRNRTNRKCWYLGAIPTQSG
jgi:hypothetical protein